MPTKSTSLLPSGKGGQREATAYKVRGIPHAVSNNMTRAQLMGLPSAISSTINVSSSMPSKGSSETPLNTQCRIPYVSSTGMSSSFQEISRRISSVYSSLATMAFYYASHSLGSQYSHKMTIFIHFATMVIPATPALDRTTSFKAMGNPMLDSMMPDLASISGTEHSTKGMCEAYNDINACIIDLTSMPWL